MSPARTLLAVLVALAAAVTLAACDDDGGAGASTTASTTAPSCARADLDLVEAGVLTVGTDTPAFPPYFVNDDPANGKGFESAVAYAIAARLGFAPDEVRWTVVPFNSSYAPGRKDFDFDINQITITARRVAQVDFSEPYYTTPQAVLVPEGSAFAGATSVSALADARFGVQRGTTSVDAVTEVVAPSTEPRVYDDSADTVRALENGQVDAIAVDLPTAIHLRDVEIPGSTIVGQFSAPGGDDWGVVLTKGSALTPCIDRAVVVLRDSGELASITEEWIGAEAPVLDLD